MVRNNEIKKLSLCPFIAFAAIIFFFVSIKAFSLLVVTRKVHSTYNRNDIIYRKNNLLTQTYINVKGGLREKIFLLLCG